MAINPDGTMTRAPGEGLTVLDAITQNYLTKRTNRGGEEAETSERITLDPADPEGSFKAKTGYDLREALRDVAPGYNPGEGPIKLDAIVPDSAFRAPAKDEGIGKIIAIAATVASIAGGIPTEFSMLTKAVSAVADGKLGISDFFSAALPSLSGVSEAFAGVGDAVDSIDASFEAVNQASSVADTAADAAKISTDPANTLLADAGQTASDATRFADPTPAVPDAERWEPGAKLDMSNADPASYSNQTASGSEGKGIISRLMDDPKTYLTGAQLAFGALKGAGDRAAMESMTDRKIEGERALLERKAALDRETADYLAALKRSNTQSGDFFGANNPVATNQTNVLRRTDGTPVYGIVASQMRG